MNETYVLDVTQSVNAIVARWPATVSVFKTYGIDACCGGALPLQVVAERHRLDLADLVTDLARAST
jgi:iron-sulfur cluster repair protein YtfE (RIC family)